MATRRRATALTAVAALAVGLVTLDAADVLPEAWPSVLTRAEPWERPAPFPTVVLEPSPAPPLVLTDLDDGAPVPTRAGLAEVTAPLLADPRLAGGAGAVVVDVLSGDVLLDEGGGEARVPASTIKLLTTTAAVTAIGEGTRLRTRVLLDDDALVLVGGGDVLLAAGEGDPGAVVGRAGLADLAAATASVLAERDVGEEVRLVLDDTLFTGPAIAPDWGPVDRAFVSPVGPVAVDRGIVRGARAADPALAAAQAFAGVLEDEGVSVGEVERGEAGAGAEEVASVASATVGELVTHALRESDNDVAEVLARLVAVEAGEPADFSHAAAAVLAALDDAGFDVGGVRMADGSGLSESNAVPPLVLARLVAAVTDPGYVTVAAGMPVAGLQGTLDDRFDADDDAAGVVRAKTGTLTTVVALAGTVLDADGRLLAVAVVGDALPVGGVTAARTAVDDWLGALARCGCS